MVYAQIISYAPLGVPTISSITGCVDRTDKANVTYTVDCVPNQLITIRGANFSLWPTSPTSIMLYGSAPSGINTYSMNYVTLNTTTAIAHLPWNIQPEDIGRPLGMMMSVQQNSWGPGFSPGVSLAQNGFTVTAVQGCGVNVNATSTAFCVAGINVTVTGSNFTSDCTLSVFGYTIYSISPCRKVSNTTLVCTLASILEPTSVFRRAFLRSTSQLYSTALASAVSYIPQAAITSVLGCAVSSQGSWPRGCSPLVPINLTVTGLVPTSVVTVSSGYRSAENGVVCQEVWRSATALGCLLPIIPWNWLNMALSLCINNSVPTKAGTILGPIGCATIFLYYNSTTNGSASSSYSSSSISSSSILTSAPTPSSTCPPTSTASATITPTSTSTSPSGSATGLPSCSPSSTSWSSSSVPSSSPIPGSSSYFMSSTSSASLSSSATPSSAPSSSSGTVPVGRGSSNALPLGALFWVGCTAGVIVLCLLVYYIIRHRQAQQSSTTGEGTVSTSSDNLGISLLQR